MGGSFYFLYRQNFFLFSQKGIKPYLNGNEIFLIFTKSGLKFYYFCPTAVIICFHFSQFRLSAIYENQIIGIFLNSATAWVKLIEKNSSRVFTPCHHYCYAILYLFPLILYFRIGNCEPHKVDIRITQCNCFTITYMFPKPCLLIYEHSCH